ncbi:hypothetical protein F4779DRAFT_551855 [Xylariaceae sp. FL0662B]|nr:hypothetical protein F4779DRAFT_551855 [Xylariaceae sp. FL0662B]
MTGRNRNAKGKGRAQPLVEDAAEATSATVSRQDTAQPEDQLQGDPNAAASGRLGSPDNENPDDEDSEDDRRYHRYTPREPSESGGEPRGIPTRRRQPSLQDDYRSERGRSEERPRDDTSMLVSTAMLRDLLASNHEATLRVVKEVFGNREVNESQGGTKPPIYNTKRLTQKATTTEVEDWIRAIREGNESKPGRSDATQIQWALTKVDYNLQTEWRSYADTLDLEPGQQVTIDHFWKFIRKEDVDPELAERSYRTDLMEIRQGEKQSPRDFYSKWSVLVRKLEDTSLQNDRRLAFDYWYKLQRSLKTTLIRQRVRLDGAQSVADEAERIWGSWDHNRGRRKRGRTDGSPNEQAAVNNLNVPGQGRGRTRQQGNRRFNDDRSKSSRTGTSRSRQDSSARRTLECYNCGKLGHKKAECRSAPRSDSSRRPQQPKAPVQNTTTQDGSGSESEGSKASPA